MSEQTGGRLVAGLVRIGVAAGALFLLLEASARVAIFGVTGLDPRRVGLWSDLDPASLATFETEPGLVWAYRPNLDVYFKGVPFRTNSLGMRDQEYGVAKPAGGWRVAVIGSSFTLPAGVEIEDAYHSRLERRCERCEFLNFAVGMHGPSQFVAMLRERALRFEPDVALVSLSALSVPRMLADFRVLPPREALRLVAPERVRSILAQLVRSRLGWERPRLALPSFAFPPPVPEAEQVVTKLGALGRAACLPIVVVRLEYDARPPSALEHAVEQRVRDEGMRYLDTRAAFRGTEARSFWVNELDPHPNAEAHARFADALEAHLRSEDLLSGSRTRRARPAACP